MKKLLLLYLSLVTFAMSGVACTEFEPVRDEGPGIDALPDINDDGDDDDKVYDTSNYKFVPEASKGVVFGEENIARMKQIIKNANSVSPGFKAYKDLISYTYAKSDWTGYVGAIPTYISRDATTAGATDGYGLPYDASVASNASMVTNHFDAAYMSALQYALGVDDADAHAAKALAILKGYAENVKCVYYTGNGPLMCGQGYHAAAALGLIKDYPAMTEEIYDSIVNDLLKGCFKPILDHFFKQPAYTNGNWGTCAILTYIAIAVVAEDEDMYNYAINQYRTGKGCENHDPAIWTGNVLGTIFNDINDNGTIYNYIDPVTGQCQETGRDVGHALFGMGCAALTCEVAYNQGHPELYLENDMALMKGMEYMAEMLLYESLDEARKNHRYFVWQDVTAATKYSNKKQICSDNSEFGYSKGFSVVYNHFVNRLGYDMPFTKKLLERETWPSAYSSEGLWFDMFTFAPHEYDQNVDNVQ